MYLPNKTMESLVMTPHEDISEDVVVQNQPIKRKKFGGFLSKAHIRKENKNKNKK
jgi:hypothetical protein